MVSYGIGLGAAWRNGRLRVASTDGVVRIWDAGTGETIHVLRGHMGAVNDVDWSPDGVVHRIGQHRWNCSHLAG